MSSEENCFLMETLGKSVHFFVISGVIAVSYVSIKLLLSLWSGLKAYVVGPALGLGTDVKRLGEWAVITGATDGIGKAYAFELAKKGMNIVLVSRTKAKLEDVAVEIGQKYSNIKTKIIAVDFTKLDIYSTIKTELTGLDIGVLVNNVGMSHVHPEYFNNFTEKDDEMLVNMINCNMTSLTLMTRLVLPKLVDKRKGAIINVSSASALVPTPLLATYAASKAYVDFFSRAVQAEVASKGVIVQCVLPFFVATKLSGIRRTNLFIPSPSTYARSALGTLGIQTRTLGCLSHAIQGWVVPKIPDFIRFPVTMSTLLGAKKRYLKKQERAAKSE